MAEDIPQWLDSIGLGQYAPAFADNGIDIEALPHLRDEDFERLGVPLGHMRRLQAAIKTLSVDDPPTRPAAPPGKQPEPRPAEAERRQLTVMFVDLVGSTALSQQLDPEDLREVMRRYQDAVAGAITRYEGYVAKFLGDGVLAYFGWPQAYEDQAERAVRAGLDTVDAVSALELPGDIALNARIGVATGQVVVGDLVGEAGREAGAVTGETPNLAARLQQLAEPDQVIIGATTHRLLGQAFELVDLGQHDLKGFPEPVPAWRVVGKGQVESRFDASHGVALTRLIGRDQEIALLLERWQRAKDGEGQVVLLSGEAGIGKSRILQTFRESLAGESYMRLRYQCAPYYSNSALHPVIKQLEYACGYATDDPAEVKLDKMETLLAPSTDDLKGSMPFFAAILSIPFEQRYGPLRLTPQQQKERTLEALIEQLLKLSVSQPVMFLFEDAHWSDPTTQELLGQVVERVQDARILMVLTHRPEYLPAWRGHSHITALALNRLSHGQCSEIVDQLAGSKVLPGEVLTQIVEKTDGVPLFVEELTKAVLESGLLVERARDYELVGSLPPLAIPATLQDSLMARLDRLGAVKEIAQIGAVIGREFSYALISAIAPLRKDQLDAALNQLVSSELVFRRGVPRKALYIFKHALVQDAAYASLLRSRRQQLHARIAATLKNQTDVEPELLAHHYTEAGTNEEALAYWQQAGEHATQRSANAEAVSHLKRALTLLEGMPASQARDEREFKLLIILGPALMDSLGWADIRVRQTYERAQALCQHWNRPKDMFMATWGLWMHHQSRSEHRYGETIAETLLTSADQAGDTELLLQAHHATWTTYLYTGRLSSAHDHAKQAIALYDPEAHGHHAFLYAGHDPGVCAYGQNAIACWLLGYPDRAVANCKHTLELAEQLQHPPSTAHGQTLIARVFCMMRDHNATERHSDAAIAFGRELGLPIYLLQGEILRGWVGVQRGESQTNIAQMREALDRRKAKNHRSGGPHMASLLADANMKIGHFEEASDLVNEALQLVEETGEGYWHADLHRLQGELHLANDAVDEAAAAFARSIDRARHQQAKSLELRTAMSLAGLWRKNGKTAEARDLLAPIYAWFTEGFDTPDLKDAKALLDELS
jgi:class 3 adenylate cyclase/predicted ATPase